jgi:hypothetical protein
MYCSHHLLKRHHFSTPTNMADVLKKNHLKTLNGGDTSMTYIERLKKSVLLSSSFKETPPPIHPTEIWSPNTLHVYLKNHCLKINTLVSVFSDSSC